MQRKLHRPAFLFFVSILVPFDILRDPTRESCKPHEMQAAVDLVSKAETNRAILLMAEQVSIEFSSHDQDVQDESLRQLKKFRENAGESTNFQVSLARLRR
jgi:hypothetical protein